MCWRQRNVRQCRENLQMESMKWVRERTIKDDALVLALVSILVNGGSITNT